MFFLFFIFCLFCFHIVCSEPVFEYQRLETRYLYPFRSYKDVQIFHFRAPEVALNATFDLKAKESSMHCEHQNVSIYLQHGGYPVFDHKDSWFPRSFYLNRTYLMAFNMSSNGTQINFTIPYPLQGDWFLLAFTRKVDEKITPKGLWTQCLTTLRVGCQFYIQDDIVPLVPEVTRHQDLILTQTISRTQFYRFMVPIGVDQFTVNISRCTRFGLYSSGSSVCPLQLAVRSQALPHRDQLYTEWRDCRGYERVGLCALKYDAFPGQWHYIRLDVMAPTEIKVHLALQVILDKSCIETKILPNNYMLVHEITKFGCDNNQSRSGFVPIPFKEKNIHDRLHRKKFIDTHCWDRIVLSRLTLAGSFNFAYQKFPPHTHRWHYRRTVIDNDYSAIDRLLDWSIGGSTGREYHEYAHSGVEAGGDSGATPSPYDLTDHMPASQQASAATIDAEFDERDVAFEEPSIQRAGRGNRYQGRGVVESRYRYQPHTETLVNVSTVRPTLLVFTLQSIHDVGGGLTVSLRLPNILDSAVVNMSVYGCLSLGRRAFVVPARRTCSHGKYIEVNSTSLENVNVSHVPFPEAGVWYLALNARCYLLDRRYSTVSYIPCPRIHSLLYVSVHSSPCLFGQCDGNGDCLQYYSGGFIFSTCSCWFGYKGWACTDSDNAISDFELLIATLLLTISNVVFIPAILLAAYRRLYAESVVYTFTMLFSTFYHACDQDKFAFCLIRQSVLQYGDFFCGIYSVWITLVAMATLDVSTRSLMHVLGAIIISIGVEYDRTGVWMFIGPTVVAACVTLLSWCCRCKSARNVWSRVLYVITGLLPGIVTSLAGFFLYAVMQTRRNYQYTHALWHVCMGVSVLFLLPHRRLVGATMLSSSSNVAGSSLSNVGLKSTAYRKHVAMPTGSEGCDTVISSHCGDTATKHVRITNTKDADTKHHVAQLHAMGGASDSVDAKCFNALAMDVDLINGGDLEVAREMAGAGAGSLSYPGPACGDALVCVTDARAFSTPTCTATTIVEGMSLAATPSSCAVSQGCAPGTHEQITSRHYAASSSTNRC